MGTKNIAMPTKKLGEFIGFAVKFLEKTSAAKDNLEFRFGSIGDKLHVSAGADSLYVEAGFESEGVDSNLYLDGNYLKKYDFASDIVLVDSDSKERVQFKSPGFNFRVPVRSGQVWNRNKVNLFEIKPETSLSLSREKFTDLHKYMELPDSFKMKEAKMVVIEPRGPVVKLYGTDALGAFCHDLKSEEYKTLTSRLSFNYSFFNAMSKIKEYDTITLSQTERLTIGEILFEGVRIRWAQPRFQTATSDVPQAVLQANSEPHVAMRLNTKDFISEVQRSTMFFSDKDYGSSPLKFKICGQEYSLSSEINGADILVNGKALEEVSKIVVVEFQAASLIDYLSFLNKDEEFLMLVFSSTVMLCQQGQDKNLLYWAPIHERFAN